MNTIAKQRAPTLFLGLDGAEPDLIHQWIDDGSLPVLAQLRREAAWGAVQTLAGFGDGATWPTLVTGVNPARHGRYFRSQFKPRSYRRTLFDVDRDLDYAPFWTTLSRAGRRVAVLDVPYARWERDINGCLLVDWLIHDRYGAPRSWPRQFARDVLDQLGDDPVGGNSDFVPKDSASLQRLSEQLLERVRMKETLVTQTLAAGQWDLVASVFTEPHDLGHVAWHLHDPSHPRHDAEWRAQHGDPLKTLYIEVDRALGRILECAPAGSPVVFFAGLGMGPDCTANRILPEILARLDRRPHQPRTLARRLRAAGAPTAIARVARMADTVREVVDLSARRYFAMPHNENSGAIRINLKGREPMGRVAPDQFDAVCDELTNAFMKLTNPVNGQPIVSRVIRVTDVLHGERMDAMPDLLVEWSRPAPFDAVESPEIGRIDGACSWGRSGDHTQHALLMLRGAGVRPGPMQRTPAVVDIAATIGALQQVELPGIDGRALTEAIAAV